jgi:hypothetical protein
VSPPRFNPDWRRLSRWCLLGTIVMVVWLLVPTARCSFAAFRDTPLGQIDPVTNEPAGADKARIDEGEGFVHRFLGGVKACYARTPLFGQEGWKTNVLVVLAGLTVVTWGLARYALRRRRTIT